MLPCPATDTPDRGWRKMCVETADVFIYFYFYCVLSLPSSPPPHPHPRGGETTVKTSGVWKHILYCPTADLYLLSWASARFSSLS